ncbi:MAG TPA: Gx transporter family protein [Acholeplasmataceae bacterium]|mgnify:CR=1 FL=1|jgi:heptaprenyl diphosphate synthase|nr:Gx transporter family protein [Acholeplasmataceae bacterium]HPX71492.1 Gx transporter family protein [Acholeplasmataceae bacterium]
MNIKLKRAVTLSMMLAIAVVLNIVEYYFTGFIPVPGAKLGLANIVVLIVLYTFGFKEAFAIAVLRVVIASLLSPGRFLSPTFYMALAGGILSVLVMWLFKKVKFFGITGVSLFGSLAHVLGQVVVGYFLIGEGLLVWLPLMLVLGIITGFLIGLIARQFLNTTKDWLSKELINPKHNKEEKNENSDDDFTF